MSPTCRRTLTTIRYPCLRVGQTDFWRRRRDSNPRYAFGAYNGLATLYAPCPAIPTNTDTSRFVRASGFYDGRPYRVNLLRTSLLGGNSGGNGRPGLVR